MHRTEEQAVRSESGIGDAALQSGCAAELREALWSAETPSPLLHMHRTEEQAVRSESADGVGALQNFLKRVKHAQFIGLEAGEGVDEGAVIVVFEPGLRAPAVVCGVVDEAVVDGVLVNVAQAGEP
jgi:hypothetical protein